MNRRILTSLTVSGLIAAGLWLSGCASPVPKPVRQPPADNPELQQVREHPERFQHRPVRWGGEIIEVRNQPAHSDVLVLARSLDDDGEPRPASAAQGRFVARVERFVDPAEYREGQRITVAGRIDGELTAPVGDYPYRYPIVAVGEWYRWPERRAVSYPPSWYHDPFYRGPFYDPFYDPWWPRRYGWPYHPYW